VNGLEILDCPRFQCDLHVVVEPAVRFLLANSYWKTQCSP
jgi:hypothetical protein